MRKFLIVFLGLSIVADIVFFVSTFIVPGVYEPYVCEDGETLETRSHETYDGTATNLYCVSREGVARDVSVTFLIPFMGIIFVAPFLMAFLLKGAVRSRKVPDTVDVDLSSIQPGVSRAPKPAAAYGDRDEPRSLTDRLQQLQQAYTMGLITQEEYDRTKQDLLEDFSE